MKAFRVSVLTVCLLVGATLTTQQEPVSSETRVSAKSSGECYLINGIWYCDP